MPADYWMDLATRCSYRCRGFRYASGPGVVTLDGAYICDACVSLMDGHACR